MNRGYVKIFREFMDKSYYTKQDYAHLWLHLLLKANHKTKSIVFRNKEMEIKRGQFLTSRKKLSKETGIQESKVERILKCLEIGQLDEQQIEQQGFAKSRLITILKYDKWQGDEQQIEQQVEQHVNNKRTTREQHVNTTKNDKNDKKDNNEKKKRKNISPEPKITFCFTTESWLNIPTRDIQRWKETYPACDIDYEIKKMADWSIANPTKKKKNYKSFISRWLTSTQDKGGSYKQVRRESMSSEALRKKMSRPVKKGEG